MRRLNPHFQGRTVNILAGSDRTMKPALKRLIVAIAVRGFLPPDMATWLIGVMGLRHV
jgi:hypothetical protein